MRVRCSSRAKTPATTENAIPAPGTLNGSGVMAGSAPIRATPGAPLVDGEDDPGGEEERPWGRGGDVLTAELAPCPRPERPRRVEEGARGRGLTRQGLRRHPEPR